MSLRAGAAAGVAAAVEAVLGATFYLGVVAGLMYRVAGAAGYLL